jgi:hypothetical protein
MEAFANRARRELQAGGEKVRKRTGRRDHRSLAVAELAQPFDNVCAGRVEHVKDKLSFSVVEREVLRPSSEVVVEA